MTERPRERSPSSAQLGTREGAPSTAEMGGASLGPAVPVPASGRRQAFRDIRRQLTDDDLANSGVQRLILDELERADEQCEVLQTYVSQFHEADKRAAILEITARSEKTVEILFGVGVGLGGTLIGLTPSVWQEGYSGIIVLAVGVVLVVGAVLARVVQQ